MKASEFDLRPMIEKFPLAKTGEAYERMVWRRAGFGVVLTMARDSGARFQENTLLKGACFLPLQGGREYNSPMEIKHLVSKYVYRIEPKPEGGFIARATDSNVPSLEAPTRSELQHKIQATILAGLSADFPGLKLPSHSTEMKFSFHVERKPDGSFDIHSSDPAAAHIPGVNDEQIESHFAEKLVTFIGKHMMPDAPEALRAQLASGDVQVFINKVSGLTVTAGQNTPFGNASGSSEVLPLSSSLDFPGASTPASPSATFSNNKSDVILSNSGNPIDPGPISPGGDSSNKILRFLLALLILTAIAFFLLRHH